MFNPYRSLTTLLLLGAFTIPVVAEPLILPQPQMVTAVIRCNTKELADEIVSAYARSATEGNRAVKDRYEQMTKYGQRFCNPVQAVPLYISQIELLDEPTTVIGPDGEASGMQVAQVLLGVTPSSITDIGFLIISEAFAEVIVGQQM